jgi:hypothetical protein
MPGFAVQSVDAEVGQKMLNPARHAESAAFFHTIVTDVAICTQSYAQVLWIKKEPKCGDSVTNFVRRFFSLPGRERS